MKKIVNGKVISIKKIELFDKALIGLAKADKVVSNTDSTLDNSINNDKVARIIKMYNAFYKAMPYPLYAIEEDIKYAALGTFIKHTQSGTEQVMFINDGLYIVLDTTRMVAVHIVNNSWAVENISEIKKDNVDIENYKDNIAYNEYRWMLNKVISMDKNANFYANFMPEFVEACNNDPMIIRWELQNILNFNSIPCKINITDNTILDKDNSCEYTLDIYGCGSTNYGNGYTRWDIGNSVKQSVNSRAIKKYDFKVYKKDLSSNDKRKLCTVDWGLRVFSSLYRIKSVCNQSEFPTYHGVVCGSTVVYEVFGSIYAILGDDNIEIANNASIYAVNGNYVYFKRITSLDDIYKVAVYRYSINDGRVSTCSIRYLSDRNEA